MRKNIFWLVVSLFAILLVLLACEPATPTPTESPLPSPAPPVSPLQEPEYTDLAYSAWWDKYVHCTHTGITPTLKIAIKWLELDAPYQLIFSETLDTGEAAPAITGTGQFDGNFWFDYPQHEKDVGEWAKAWWSIPGGGAWHCFNEWGSLVEVDEVEAEWFQGGSQDAERYWFVRQVAGVTPTPTPTAIPTETPTPTPSWHVYCPLFLRGEVPTEATPTPTPTPDAGGSGSTGRTAALVVGVCLLTAVILIGIWYARKATARHQHSDFLRR